MDTELHNKLLGNYNQRDFNMMTTAEQADILKRICTGRSGDIEIEQAAVMTFLDYFSDIFQPRQQKYGRGNIAMHGAMGCVVRLDDKLARLRRVYIERKTGTFTDETLIDGWRDALGYSLIGLMCALNRWPGAPGTEPQQKLTFIEEVR